MFLVLQMQLTTCSIEIGYVQESRGYKEPSIKRAENKINLKRAKSKKLPLNTLNC